MFVRIGERSRKLGGPDGILCGAELCLIFGQVLDVLYTRRLEIMCMICFDCSLIFFGHQVYSIYYLIPLPYPNSHSAHIYYPHNTYIMYV